MSEPMNELLVITRQELLKVFKEWYGEGDHHRAVDACDYIIHQLNENKSQ